MLYGAMFDPGDAFDDNNPATSDRDDEATEVFLEADFRF